MARALVAALARVLRAETRDTVHTHGGPDGAYVCEDPNCSSPSLSVHAA